MYSSYSHISVKPSGCCGVVQLFTYPFVIEPPSDDALSNSKEMFSFGTPCKSTTRKKFTRFRCNGFAASLCSLNAFDTAPERFKAFFKSTLYFNVWRETVFEHRSLKFHHFPWMKRIFVANSFILTFLNLQNYRL